MSDDKNAVLAWRNLVADWHLKQGMPDCGCDDDTLSHQFCPASVAWADSRLAERRELPLDSPPDRWNHDVWVAAWGRNAPLIADDLDFRLPKPPAGLTWLVTRMLVRGQQAVEVALLRLSDSQVTTLNRIRSTPDSGAVAECARRMLQRSGI